MKLFWYIIVEKSLKYLFRQFNSIEGGGALDDKKLIRECQKGEKEAFQELISKYHPFVYKFLVKITEDEYIAQDLTQTTFLKIIKNIDKFGVNGKAKFSTYIIAIAKNSYIDYLRKEKNFMQAVPIDESISIEDIGTNIEEFVLDKMSIEDIMSKMNNLTEEQRMVIKMKYIEGLTLKEIGEKLDLEPKTIKSRIHNGIVKLRKMLERED